MTNTKPRPASQWQHLVQMEHICCCPLYFLERSNRPSNKMIWLNDMLLDPGWLVLSTQATFRTKITYNDPIHVFSSITFIWKYVNGYIISIESQDQPFNVHSHKMTSLSRRGDWSCVKSWSSSYVPPPHHGVYSVYPWMIVPRRTVSTPVKRWTILHTKYGLNKTATDLLTFLNAVSWQKKSLYVYSNLTFSSAFNW